MEKSQAKSSELTQKPSGAMLCTVYTCPGGEMATKAKRRTRTSDEEIRTRRVPGIVFVDGATGRRAALAGTGLDVWEVIATWQEGGKSYDGQRRVVSEAAKAGPIFCSQLRHRDPQTPLSARTRSAAAPG